MRARVLLGALLLALGTALSGSAVADAPQEVLTDPCGIDGLLAAPDDGATTPETDVCNAAFAQPDGEGTLQVALRVAGEVGDDRRAEYAVGWRVGACSYALAHDRGVGSADVGGLVRVDGRDRDVLTRSCGTPVEHPCAPVDQPVVTCVEPPPTQELPLPDDAVEVRGDTVVWTLRSVGQPAEVAADLAPGTVLAGTWASARSKAGTTALSPSVCVGDTCPELLRDSARGGDWTVPGR